MIVTSQKCEKFYPLSEWPELYADYLNNFLTVARFAEYYGLTDAQAGEIVYIGKKTDNFSKPFTF